MVSAWACRQRLVLGQEAVRDKSNEITAIPLLLERLALTGALVTIDAIGTQTKIAETIVTRGGDYLLTLKPNRPLLFAEVEAFFKGPEAGSLDTCDTTDADHGRLEIRRHAVCHHLDWLFSDRRYPGEPKFPRLAMIARVQTEVQRNGTIEHETATPSPPRSSTPKPSNQDPSDEIARVFVVKFASPSGCSNVRVATLPRQPARALCSAMSRGCDEIFWRDWRRRGRHAAAACRDWVCSKVLT